MKKTNFYVLAGLILGLSLLTPLMAVKAFGVRSGDNVAVAKSETIDGNFYAAGNNLTIDGHVLGDVLCVGSNIIINGQVDGDVLCAGQVITVNGSVNGSIRAAGNAITINGPVARNVMVAGNSINLTNQASVGWDALFAANSFNDQAKIGRSVNGAAASVVINNEVASDVNLYFDRQSQDSLVLGDNAKINGNLIYQSADEFATINSAKVAGKIQHNLPPARNDNAWNYLWSKFVALFAALLIGLVLVSLFPKQIKEIVSGFKDKVGTKFGIGALLLIVTPLAALILLITLIGAPLAIIIVALWLIMIYLSDIVIAIWLGNWINKKLKWSDNLKITMIVGVVAFAIITAIPVLGALICLAGILYGLGAMWQYWRK